MDDVCGVGKRKPLNSPLVRDYPRAELGAQFVLIGEPQSNVATSASDKGHKKHGRFHKNERFEARQALESIKRDKEASASAKPANAKPANVDSNKNTNKSNSSSATVRPLPRAYQARISKLVRPPQDPFAPNVDRKCARSSFLCVRLSALIMLMVRSLRPIDYEMYVDSLLKKRAYETVDVDVVIDHLTASRYCFHPNSFRSLFVHYINDFVIV